jgi:hypothetical protein
MKNARYPSVLGQMIYVIVAGLQLLFIPNLMLGIFGFEPTSEIWIRVMGMLVLALTFYYYAIAHHGNDAVVMRTVYGRLFFCTGLVIFVILGMAKPALIGFALAEAGLAVWSWREVNSKK